MSMLVRPELAPATSARRSCATSAGLAKRTYANRRAANKALAAMRTVQGGASGPLNIYRCANCRRYHLGHPSR